jgi:hypothetical protein
MAHRSNLAYCEFLDSLWTKSSLILLSSVENQKKNMLCVTCENCVMFTFQGL